MKTIRFVILFCTLMFAAIVVPVMAADEATCTTVPGDASGLPDCATRHDNECYPGGALYREDNQDGCPSEWYWKAGWYLARLNDGKISRSDVPDEFASVLPPLSTSEEPAPTPGQPSGSCTITYHVNTGMTDFDMAWATQPGQTHWTLDFVQWQANIGGTIGPLDNSYQFSFPMGTGRSPTEVRFVLVSLIPQQSTTGILSFLCTFISVT